MNLVINNQGKYNYKFNSLYYKTSNLKKIYSMDLL